MSSKESQPLMRALLNTDLGLTDRNCACACAYVTAEQSDVTHRADTVAGNQSVAREPHQVAGMTCNHCAVGVSEELSSISGVSGVANVLVADVLVAITESEYDLATG